MPFIKRAYIMIGSNRAHCPPLRRRYAQLFFSGPGAGASPSLWRGNLRSCRCGRQRRCGRYLTVPAGGLSSDRRCQLCCAGGVLRSGWQAAWDARPVSHVRSARSPTDRHRVPRDCAGTGDGLVEVTLPPAADCGPACHAPTEIGSPGRGPSVRRFL